MKIGMSKRTRGTNWKWGKERGGNNMLSIQYAPI